MLTELRQTWRSVWRRPASSLTIVATLGTGLTVSACLFAILDGLILKPLPLANPEHLFVVGGRSLSRPGEPGPMGHRDVEALQTLPGVTGAFGYSVPAGFFDPEAAREEGLRDAAVTRGFFATVGRHPLVGRSLDAWDSPQEPRQIVISSGLWQRRFAADPGALGQVTTLGGRTVTVVGVMPPSFDFPVGANVWLADATGMTHPAMRGLTAVVRAPRGSPAVTISAGETAAARPLRLFLRPVEVRSVLGLFAATAVLVLLTWVHLAGFTISESVLLARDVAVKSALGADWGRLVREQMARTVALCALALSAAAFALPSVLSVCVLTLPPELTRGQPIAPDYRTLAYLAGLTLLGAVAVGMGPLLAIRRVRLADALNGRASASRRVSFSRIRWVLLGTEVAFVTVLVYVAGLATHSLIASSRVDLGVVGDQVVSLDLPHTADSPSAVSVVELVRQQIGQLPGVRAVAAGEFPVGASKNPVSVVREGTTEEPAVGLLTRNALQLGVSPGYFNTVGIRVVEGSDRETSRRGDIVAVSEMLARLLNLPPPRIGSRLRVNGTLYTVAAVVGDVRLDGPESPPAPLVYVPGFLAERAVLVRATDRIAQLTPALVASVRRVTGHKGRLQVQLARDICRRTTASSRSRSIFLGVFGTSSFLLGMLGVFAAATEVVRRERRDTAIRMALGASRNQVVTATLWRTLRVVAIGTAAGLLLAVAVGRSLSSVLFGVMAADTLSAVVTFTGVLSVGSAAAAIPAFAAARVPPLGVLRSQ